MPPGTTTPTIRPYADRDLDDLYEICVRTGAAGGDARELLTDHRLQGEIWVAPYVRHAPELAFVVEDEDGVAGYVLGVADTRSYERWAEANWWPDLRMRYPVDRFPPDALESLFVALIHSPPIADDEVTAGHPAHLHIDLLPRIQKQGLGRRLIDQLFNGLRQAGADHVHLGVAAANANAIAFYRRVGFTTLHEDGVSLVLGRSTEPTG